MMTLRRLVTQSLWFHRRSHLGVVLGAAVGCAALVGALVVGDSVRESLKDRARARLGKVGVALDTGDNLVTENLARQWQTNVAGQLATNGAVPPADRGSSAIRQVLHLRGTASRQDGTARAHDVQIYGVHPDFWSLAPARVQPGSPAEPAAQGPNHGHVFLNAALAEQLHASIGDTLLLRFPKPSALSPDAVLAARDPGGALRLEVSAILDATALGDFDLRSSQRPALNAFVAANELQAAGGVGERVNLLLAPASNDLLSNPTPGSRDSTSSLDMLQAALEPAWTLDDAQIQVRVLSRSESNNREEAIPAMVEIVTPRIFLSDPIVAAAKRISPTSNRPTYSDAVRSHEGVALPITTYLANAMIARDRLTPYSMVTAAGPPWTPAGLQPNEIIVTDWLASDLEVRAGDRIDLVYFDPEAGARLVERTNAFTVHSVVPMRGIYADRSLMPEFPGLANAERTSDWDAGFPLVHEIRDKDEAYWHDHRGTPKAFVSEQAGITMWGNRFGHATAIRYVIPDSNTPQQFQQSIATGLRSGLHAADVALVLQPVRALGMKAATSGQDFGQLFLGFSFFLVIASMLLVALLFQFGLEQRVAEVGTLLALGFRPRTIRGLFLGEGAALALVGSVIGIFGGLYFAKALIRGLTTVWKDAVGGVSLAYHATFSSIAMGLVASVVVAVLTLAWTLRRVAKQSARELLAGQTAPLRQGRRSRGLWIGIASGLAGLGLVGWAFASGQASNPLIFFGAGSLLLIAGLAIAAAWFGRSARQGLTQTPGDKVRLTATGLAARGMSRRRSRSLATAALLACGTFLIASIGAFRMEAGKDAWRRESGTGGFGLIGEASIPISQDLNTTAGLEFFGLDTNEVSGVRFVPFRVRNGDDASCLNLDRAQRPRILGVDPTLLSSRGAFTFAQMDSGFTGTNGWDALKATEPADNLPANGAPNAGVLTIPAIGDSASIQWALGKKIGDTVEMTDERGRRVQLRLVGGIANSILQGSLVIDEEAFRRLFPGESGHRFFLIDTPTQQPEGVAATLSRALADTGFEVIPATRRLAQFNAVQNTYLTTFQVLGGLGMLLGSAGLGVVVLRNVLERRGEIALLTAVGYPRRLVARLILLEHTALLMVGLAIGLASAAVAIAPSLLSPTELPFRSLGFTLGGVLILGLSTTWMATRSSLKGQLLSALRGE